MEHDDKHLQQSVSAALEWAPDVTSAHIGVTAKDGVVTLSGHVMRFAEKVAAERVASQVKGVRAIAEEIEVRFPGQVTTDDEAIAAKAVAVLSWNTMLPSGRIEVKVEHGWVSLSGEVDWQYQRALAAQDIHRLDGVKGISNKIQLATQIQPADVKHKVEDAMKRDAMLEAAGIQVAADNHTITLSGHVRTWHERAVAESAAWSAPGVTAVVDRIAVA
jgi:osmotically-inducible protein OsmY